MNVPLSSESNIDRYTCLLISCRTIVKFVSANYNKQDKSNTIVVHNPGWVLPGVVCKTSKRGYVSWDVRNRKTDQ